MTGPWWAPDLGECRIQYQVDVCIWWLDNGRPERAASRPFFRAADHFWPLYYLRHKGIPAGLQYHLLGQLAAMYARDFTTSELAAELKAVMEASPQDRRDPWTWGHARSTAERVKRFIEREDQKQDAAMASFMAWYGGGPAARQPGARQTATRKPGVRA